LAEGTVILYTLRILHYGNEELTVTSNYHITPSFLT